MLWWVMPWPVMLASHMGTGSRHLIQLPAHVPEKAAEDAPSGWTPITHMGNEVLALPSPASAKEAIYEVN